MKKIFLFLLILVAFSACMNTRIQSPEGKSLKLGHKTGEITPAMENRAFFWAWGLKELTDPSSDVILATVEDNKTIVAQTQFSLIDYLIGAVGSNVTIYSKTLEIEVLD